MSNISNIYKKDFNSWNKKKKNINDKEYLAPLFKEKDIWWLSVGINIGFEEDGKHENFVRPVLILKKFNRMLFFGIPLSKQIKNNPYYFPITLKKEKVSALISQIRVFSSKRIWNKIGELDSKDYNKIIKYIRGKILPLSPKGKSRG
jgi:mRNA interferase MazF